MKYSGIKLNSKVLIVLHSGGDPIPAVVVRSSGQNIVLLDQQGNEHRTTRHGLSNTIADIKRL